MFSFSSWRIFDHSFNYTHGQGTPNVTDKPDLVSWGAHANLTFDEMLDKLYDPQFIQKVTVFCWNTKYSYLIPCQFRSTKLIKKNLTPFTAIY